MTDQQRAMFDEFTEAMWRQLELNERRGKLGWEDDSLASLTDHGLSEVTEVYRLIHAHGGLEVSEIRAECADAANMFFMVFDNAGRLR